MNERILDILDQSLTFSLWIFLAVLTVFLLFANQSLRTRKRNFSDHQFEEQHETVRQNNTFQFLPNETRIIFQTLFLSLGIASLAFILSSFLPITGLENFANLTSRKSVSLRVTSLHHNRFHEGFSLQGEVWNQTQEPMSNLKVIISIWQSNQDLLDTISVPVIPNPVSGSSSGTFKLQYEKYSPLLYGYRLAFENSEGKPISHLEGLDVE